jgi:hypothetical protein
MTSRSEPLTETVGMTADELLREIRRRGGRIFRGGIIVVFVITSNQELASWLLAMPGAMPYKPVGSEPAYATLPLGAYERAKGGTVEWDIVIHGIPVDGEESIYDAAGRLARTVNPAEYA